MPNSLSHACGRSSTTADPAAARSDSSCRPPPQPLRPQEGGRPGTFKNKIKIFFSTFFAIEIFTPENEVPLGVLGEAELPLGRNNKK